LIHFYKRVEKCDEIKELTEDLKTTALVWSLF